MRISNLSILLVVVLAFVMGCAGKRNQEFVTTYWNAAHDCQADCRNCANNSAVQGIESLPINQSSSSDSTTSMTDLRSTTRRSLSTIESTSSGSAEVQLQPGAVAFRSPLKSLTPAKDLQQHADGNRPEGSSIPKIAPQVTLDRETGSQEITSQEWHPVKPLPVFTGEVVDKLPSRNRPAVIDEHVDQEPVNHDQPTGEKNSPLKAKGVATETEKQDSVATSDSPDSDPRFESFRLQDLFPNSMPNATLGTKPDTGQSVKTSVPPTDDDIDWGLPKIFCPNGSQSQGNRGGDDHWDEPTYGNQGDDAPPLSAAGSWQGSSSFSDRRFSNRSEQEIIRELRRSNLATRNGFGNMATITEQQPGRKVVLLTAQPVPHYQQQLQIDQERNATAQTRSDVSNNPLIGSTPNRIPARTVSNRQDVPFDEDFDFRPIPELPQPGELRLEPVEAEKFIEEVIETFSLPPLPPITSQPM